MLAAMSVLLPRRRLARTPLYGLSFSAQPRTTAPVSVSQEIALRADPNGGVRKLSIWLHTAVTRADTISGVRLSQKTSKEQGFACRPSPWPLKLPGSGVPTASAEGMKREAGAPRERQDRHCPRNGERVKKRPDATARCAGRCRFPSAPSGRHLASPETGPNPGSTPGGAVTS